jgi:NAD(P)-dependent dehydrogenase (short-subunit alcohol dehydrogenase family)
VVIEKKMSRNLGIYPSLSKKVVIVTGGASGIGAEIVSAFVKQGAKVGFIDLNADASQKLVKTLGENVHFEICDLCDISAMKIAMKKLTTLIGTTDILVNNAGSDDRHDWKDVTEDYWNERLSTNLRHQFFAIQHVAHGMIKKGGGSIINIGSNSWWEAGGGFPAYATAKSAVHGLTRTMARDLGQHRIRVNTVVPGWIMTERQKTLWVTPEGLENQYKRQCLPDLIDPIYVARMVLFLASDDALMCTANNYMVEAGSI